MEGKFWWVFPGGDDHPLPPQPLAIDLRKNDMLVSIFNDVIGPVMRGPSSSHCAAALRIGQQSGLSGDGLPLKIAHEYQLPVSFR